MMSLILMVCFEVQKQIAARSVRIVEVETKRAVTFCPLAALRLRRRVRL
jgi:hypothetical protein